MADRPTLVLLIEDNPGDAHLIRNSLTRSGREQFTVEWVDRHADGLDRLKRGGVDVVLLDLELPDASGVATLTGVRSQAPDVPIVVLTAHDDEPLAMEVLRQGAQDYLCKGEFEPRTLRRALRYAIERARAEQDLRASTLRYRLLFDENPAGVFVARPDGQLVECNDSFARILGYEGRDEVDSIRDLFVESAAYERLLAGLRYGAHFGTPHLKVEVALRGAGGREVRGLVDVREVRDQSGVCLHGILVDIGERRRLEALERRLTTLAARAHQMNLTADEIARPLAVIASHLQAALRQASADDLLRGRIERALAAGREAEAVLVRIARLTLEAGEGGAVSPGGHPDDAAPDGAAGRS
jgi:PAS domain S-box-containing protein